MLRQAVGSPKRGCRSSIRSAPTAPARRSCPSGPPEDDSRNAPSSPTATLVALAAAGRNSTDLILPTAGSQAGSGGGQPAAVAGPSGTTTAAAGSVGTVQAEAGGSRGGQMAQRSHGVRPLAELGDDPEQPLTALQAASAAPPRVQAGLEVHQSRRAIRRFGHEGPQVSLDDGARPDTRLPLAGLDPALRCCNAFTGELQTPQRRVGPPWPRPTSSRTPPSSASSPNAG